MNNKEGFYSMHPEVIIEFNKNHGTDESLEIIKKAAGCVKKQLYSQSKVSVSSKKSKIAKSVICASTLG